MTETDEFILDLESDWSHGNRPSSFRVSLVDGIKLASGDGKGPWQAFMKHISIPTRVTTMESCEPLQIYFKYDSYMYPGDPTKHQERLAHTEIKTCDSANSVQEYLDAILDHIQDNMKMIIKWQRRRRNLRPVFGQINIRSIFDLQHRPSTNRIFAMTKHHPNIGIKQVVLRLHNKSSAQKMLGVLSNSVTLTFPSPKANQQLSQIPPTIPGDPFIAVVKCNLVGGNGNYSNYLATIPLRSWQDENIASANLPVCEKTMHHPYNAPVIIDNFNSVEIQIIDPVTGRAINFSNNGIPTQMTLGFQRAKTIIPPPASVPTPNIYVNFLNGQKEVF